MYTFSMNFDLDQNTRKNFLDLFNRFGVPNTIIEIGVYEGWTTMWLSDVCGSANKKFQLYAIDPHCGSSDLPDSDFKSIKDNFINNVNYNLRKNIVYLNDFSTDALRKLIDQHVQAEIIYVDGDHNADQVLTDLVLSYLLLPVGGIMLCDDSVNWSHVHHDQRAIQHTPRLAVDSFIHCFWDKVIQIPLPCSTQVAIKKLK